MNRIILASATMIAIIAIATTSCKKVKPDTETQSAVDNNICETEFTKSMTVVNAFAIKENGVKSMQEFMSTLSGSPSVFVDPDDTLNGFPVTMVIDYGNTGIYDSIDHKTRKGRLICKFSDRWHIIGSSVKVNLVNYAVDGVAYSCDSMILTHNAAYSYRQQIYKGKAFSSEFTLEWEATRTFTQTAGMSDLNPYNDVFSLTGSANGVSREGKAYTVEITSPLIKRSSCSWIESGKMMLTPEGLVERTVDFGNGTCDSQATLIITGNTFVFTMN